MGKRKVPENSFQHVYKISVDGGVVFYRTIDHLVYYTIQSVMARKHNLSVLAACHMFTHVHGMVAAVDPGQLVRYEQDVNSIFAREYNRETGRKGRLFKGPFGSAAQRTEKEQRSSLVYVFNNPVEKRLCRRAIEDRWTFLAYYQKEYPFSEKPILKYCRWVLRDSLRVVDQEFKAGRYCRYQMLFQLFAKLNEQEREQLTDYIIQRYFFFQKEACFLLFGSWERMVETIDVTKGKEFNVGEVYEPFSDVPYREMCTVVGKHGLLNVGLPLLRLSEEKRYKMVAYLRNNTSASERQAARFLHIGGEA